MSVTNGKLLAYLAAKGEIISTQYSEDQVTVHCKLPQKYLGRIDPTDVIVTPHNPSAWPTTETKVDQPTKETISDAALDANPQSADATHQQYDAILTPTDPPAVDLSHPMDDSQ